MNVSRFKATGLTIMLTICLAVAGSSLHAVTQQSSIKSEDKLLLNELSNKQADKRANELIKSVNSLASANDRYLKAMKDASPEDRLVLELQQWLLQRRAGKDLHQLGDVRLILEKNRSNHNFAARLWTSTCTPCPVSPCMSTVCVMKSINCAPVNWKLLRLNATP